MNSFSHTISGKHFTCPSIPIDSFGGQSNLGCRSLFFISLNTFCQSLVTCKVSLEKSADSLMGTPLQVTLYFSLSAFKSLFTFKVQGIGNIFEKIVKENFLKMTKVIDVNTQEAESPISFRVPSHLGLCVSGLLCLFPSLN